MSLCVPLLEIADRLWNRSGRDVPLDTGRTRNFYGVEKTALAISNDLAMRPLHTRGDELRFDVMDGQGMTQLATVVLRRAMARGEGGVVGNSRGVPGRQSHFPGYPQTARHTSTLDAASHGGQED